MHEESTPTDGTYLSLHSKIHRGLFGNGGLYVDGAAPFSRLLDWFGGFGNGVSWGVDDFRLLGVTLLF